MGQRSADTGSAFRALYRGAVREFAAPDPISPAPREQGLKAFLWAAAITAAELGARRVVGGRARAWLVAYPFVAAAAAMADQPVRRRQRPMPGALWLGVPLALFGYPIGCALLGHRWGGAPPDDEGVELVALAAAVAPAEELAWGIQVERRVGAVPTAVLFAAKHVAIDGRWTRALGLALFWTGLGMVRSRSPMLALGVHAAANAGGVILGHATGRDRF